MIFVFLLFKILANVEPERYCIEGLKDTSLHSSADPQMTNTDPDRCDVLYKGPAYLYQAPLSPLPAQHLHRKEHDEIRDQIPDLWTSLDRPDSTSKRGSAGSLSSRFNVNTVPWSFFPDPVGKAVAHRASPTASG